jgi:type III pantothenate kinase
MVNLAIDLGNTNAHIAVFSRGKAVRSMVFPAADVGSVQKKLSKVLGIYKDKVTAAGISSVRKGNNRLWISACIKLCRIEPLLIGNRTNVPVNIMIRNAASLGSDRICNAVYGYKRFKGRNNVVIISLGTAVTLDVVLKNGNFIGGIIAPGLSISARALNQYTGKLPLLKDNQLVYNKSLTGADTTGALRTGIVNFSVYAIGVVLSELEKKFRTKFKVVVAGGAARKVRKQLKHESVYAGNAVLGGIDIILNYNRK